jgi:hypothetical protein
MGHRKQVAHSTMEACQCKRRMEGNNSKTGEEKISSAQEAFLLPRTFVGSVLHATNDSEFSDRSP